MTELRRRHGDHTAESEPALPPGVVNPLFTQLERVTHRLTTLEEEFTLQHVAHLRGELALFERTIDSIQHELEWRHRLSAERLRSVQPAKSKKRGTP